MKEYKLSDEQKIIFNKYNMYLIAILGDSGVRWESYIYFDDGIDYIQDAVPNVSGGWERRSDLLPEDPGFVILNDLAINIIKSSENSFYEYLDGDEHRSANIQLIYNPETKVFNLRLDIFVRKGEYSEITKKFDEIINQEQPWYAQNQEKLYKKLNNDEYVQKLIDEHDGETFFEFPYNGYGDSGEIDSSLSYNDDLLNIAYEIIDLYHGGWENDNGADGTINIDLENKEVSVYHTYYYEDTEEQEIEKIKLV